MPLNIVKLCVGCDSVEQLRRELTEEAEVTRARGRPVEFTHTTRQFPRRKDDIIPGGSFYWVIRGFILVRHPLIDLRPVTGADGIERCQIVYAEALIPTRPWPRRAFQGWRYLTDADAPPDLRPGETAVEDADPVMRKQLLELGLL